MLTVVYLTRNEGYSGPGQPAESLASEAIRLGRVLAALLPAEPEVLGLLALMLLHDARREARFDGQDLVLLPDQDQSRWDWRQITEARDLLDHALLDPSLQQAPTARGPYALQAAVASLQAETPLDWPQVAALYGELADRTGSDVVRLNRAVAIAEAGDPAAALAIVDGLDLPGYQYWHSTRAELLRRLGRAAEARAAYREALALAPPSPNAASSNAGSQKPKSSELSPPRSPARRAGDTVPFFPPPPPRRNRWPCPFGPPGQRPPRAARPPLGQLADAGRAAARPVHVHHRRPGDQRGHAVDRRQPALPARRCSWWWAATRSRTRCC